MLRVLRVLLVWDNDNDSGKGNGASASEKGRINANINVIVIVIFICIIRIVTILILLYCLGKFMFMFMFRMMIFMSTAYCRLALKNESNNPFIVSYTECTKRERKLQRTIIYNDDVVGCGLVSLCVFQKIMFLLRGRSAEGSFSQKRYVVEDYCSFSMIIFFIFRPLCFSLQVTVTNDVIMASSFDTVYRINGDTIPYVTIQS